MAGPASRPPGDGEPDAARRETLLVDGHVHMRRCFGAADFLNRARANLVDAARTVAENGWWRGVLLFTEDAGADRFAELFRMALREDHPAPRWWLELTGEDESLVARSNGGGELILAAGRQIVTRERLEVLAPCTRERFPDGEGLRETLSRVRSAGTVPVLPWGLGKWWRTRGERVRQAVEEAAPGELLLGDNAGRPRGAGDPPLFRRARERGLAVLGGSDPLPFPSEVRRVGGYGSLLPVPSFDPERPAEEVRARLLRPRPETEAFGARVAPLRFLWCQARIRAPVPSDA